MFNNPLVISLEDKLIWFNLNNFCLNRAIQESLELCQEAVGGLRMDGMNDMGDGEEASNESLENAAEQLRLALRLSERQQMEEEQRRLLEEETFRQVLELSLTDK